MLYGGKMKKIVIFLACVMSAALLFAQQRTERTAEEEYLNSSVEILISILAGQDDLQSKIDALDEAEKIIESGKATEGIRKTVEGLAGEGTKRESRTSGRLVNNFFEVRLKACDLLARIHTEPSKEALKQVLSVEKEPTVLAAAIRGLGDIGLNDDDDAVVAIRDALRKNSAVNPNGGLAVSALEAFDKLAPTVSSPAQRKDMLDAIAGVSGNASYNRDVRDRARELHKKLRVTLSKQ
jgi:hypothetical protein